MLGPKTVRHGARDTGIVTRKKVAGRDALPLFASVKVRYGA